MIKKYIKKNIEVEAIQLREDNIEEVLELICDGYDFDCCFDSDKKDIINAIKCNDFYWQVNGTKVKFKLGDYIVKGYNGLVYKISAEEFEASYQETNNFIDLNKLKNYECFTKGASLKEQLEKVFEEMKEFKAETNGFYIDSTNIISEKELLENRDNIIAEALDDITAKINLLYMLNATKEDFDKHIAKLDRYKETKYKK